jgi:hypothetical protein
VCEQLGREKGELAVALEIMRKEKCLVEVEKQLLANERNKLAERERALERRMKESHPQAESLALTYAHLLDVLPSSLDPLTNSQGLLLTAGTHPSRKNGRGNTKTCPWSRYQHCSRST